jgi:hypothetical protein
LHRRDIFPFALGRAALALSGTRPSLFAPDRLHELVQANLSFREAVEEIYLLPAGSACALPTAPSSALGVAAHALTPLIQQRLVSAVSHARPI